MAADIDTASRGGAALRLPDLPPGQAIFQTPPQGALAWALAGWAERHGDWLHVLRRESALPGLAAMARGFAPQLQVLALPAWDSLPYDRAQPSREVTGARVAALHALRTRGGPRLVLTSAAGLLQRVPSRARLAQRAIRLAVGDELDLAWLDATLAAFGYAVEERVEAPGQTARHGAGVDLHPAASAAPVRLDVEDGRISALRRFDPVDQRSTGDLAELTLLPVSEAFAVPGEAGDAIRERLLPDDACETLFDYLPDAASSLDAGVRERLDDWQATIRDAYETRLVAARVAGDGAVEPPERLYLNDGELARLEAAQVAFADAGEVLAEAVPGDPAANGNDLVRLVRARLAAGDAVLVGAADADAQAALLRRRFGPEVAVLPGLADMPAGELAVLGVPLAEGFRRDGVSVLAAPIRRARSGGARGVWQPDPLRVGDLVIEPTHGLAQLTGLQIVDPDEAARECLTLAFTDAAAMLVPAEEAGRVWRYGSGDAAAARDRLSGESWIKRSEDVARDIASTAAGIAERKRVRAETPAPEIVPPRAEFDRFRRRVPFALTGDQQDAVDAILADLARGRPMERLLCGDVGFGKTEVALHAAVAVALTGRQVALAAPTTLLAGQHFETFRRRCAGLGIAVEKLIRSTRSTEARAALRRIAAGEARIVVGTHALATPGLRFADLGLLIVDEEQRFGDRHKTGLRALRQGVHALTMTATPLPRSLQSAFVGLYDLSLLTEPPVARQPVRSFVLDFNPVVLRTALLRESRRGGQSFVICPRIEDMAPLAAHLAEQVPELTVAQAHGRMRGEALDRAMLGFAEGRSDVLLATSIVESGLDIPNANTMLVWRPERFGLAELHQLRGRVGRGRARAVAYLLTDPAAPPSPVARKRLERIAALESLGAGFAIGAADLDLRGAGDLLGEAQSGHVRLLGSELYGALLERALAEAAGQAPAPAWRPEVAIEVAAFIPADSVPEADVRLELYRRLDRLESLDAIEDFAAELEDRFGEAAGPLDNLLALARLRLACRGLDVAALHAGPEAVALTPRAECDRAALAARLSAEPRGERLILKIAEKQPDRRLRRVLDALG